MMKAFLGPEVKEARYGLASVRMPNVGESARPDREASHRIAEWPPPLGD